MDDNQDGVSAEMRAMKWEWTPSLLELRQRGWDTHFNYHPDLGPHLNEDLDYKYSPSLPVPAYDDKRGMMRFCGLNDTTIDGLLEEYDRKHGEETQSQFEIEQSTNGRTGVEFPVLDCLVYLFTHRDEGDLFDYEESYEGYIKKGVQQGLRPEFALQCGLHEDDPREKAKQFSTFTPPQPNWYKHSPMYYVDEIFKKNWAKLIILWSEKLRADGIVKETDHGDVLVENQAAAGLSGCGREPDGARAECKGVV